MTKFTLINLVLNESEMSRIVCFFIFYFNVDIISILLDLKSSIVEHLILVH